MTSNKGNVLVYNLNGFKFVGKIEYDYEDKKKHLLNNCEKVKSKSDLVSERLQLNNKEEHNKNTSSGFFIKNIFLDEDSDLVVINYSDNSISIFPYSKSIKNKNPLLGSKYTKTKNAFNFDAFNNQNQFNLELNVNNSNKENQKTFFLFSHFERVTDICWLNNNYKSFVTCSTDQSLMLWNYRGDKWINSYFDLLKIFDKNLNNFENQVLNEDELNSLENGKFLNYTKDEEKEKVICDNSLYKIKYFINVIISHPKQIDLMIAGDNKGNIYQFDRNLKEQPKKFVVGNFAINSLSFSRIGNYLAVGFSTGNVIVVDFINNYKFCSVIEEYNNDDNEIKERIRKNMLLSYCHIFKKNTYVDNMNSININLNSILKNSETENSTIKIISMNSYKTLRIQLIKKSLLSNNLNLYDNMKNKLDFHSPDRKDVNSNIPNNYFNSTIKNYIYNYKIKKIEMHVSEDYLIILFENNNILINRIESNTISGVITLNNNHLEFYDINSDPSGLYLAVLSDAFANQEEFEPKSFENYKKGLSYEGKESNFNVSNHKFNPMDKNRSIDFKSNDFRITVNKKNNNDLDKSTIKNGFDDRDDNIKLTSNELSSLRDNIRKQSSIIIYEIGTGNFVCILKNLFLISKFKFSNDGRFICITSESGAVSVWNTSGEIRENILSVLEEIKINPRLWESFRINFCLENAERFNFFQKIEKVESHRNNYDLDKNIEDRKHDYKINRPKSRNQNGIRNSQRNGANSSLNFSPDYERKAIAKRTQSKENKKTDLITNREATNIPTKLNNAKFVTTDNIKDTSYKSVYLNYETKNNINYKNSVREMNFSSSNFEENPLKKSSRGKIFSNYPMISSNDNYIKFKNSSASKDKDFNSTKGGIPNMLYSSSNLYKRSFQVEEFVNLDNKASKADLNFINKENYEIINSNQNGNIDRPEHMINSNFRSPNDYLINFSKEKMIVNAFPDPEDIDDFVNDNFGSSGKKVSSPLMNQLDFNPSSDNIITEEFFENSKIKGSTADEIEYIENNINKFERNFVKKLDINNSSIGKHYRDAPANKENSYSGSLIRDSIDN